VAEDGHYNRQSHRRLRGRHGHHEEDDNLPAHIGQIAAVSDEREIDGVQHQLNGHKYNERVAAGENPGDADAEHQRRQG